MEGNRIITIAAVRESPEKSYVKNIWLDYIPAEDAFRATVNDPGGALHLVAIKMNRVDFVRAKNEGAPFRE